MTTLSKISQKNIKTQIIPIVILTNSISVHDMNDFYRHGSAGFIQKSVNNEEYNHAIKTTINYRAKTVVLPCTT